MRPVAYTAAAVADSSGYSAGIASAERRIAVELPCLLSFQRFPERWMLVFCLGFGVVGQLLVFLRGYDCTSGHVLDLILGILQFS